MSCDACARRDQLFHQADAGSRHVGAGIRDRQGDYLFAVKANQPELMAGIALAFGDAFPPPFSPPNPAFFE